MEEWRDDGQMVGGWREAGREETQPDPSRTSLPLLTPSLPQHEVCSSTQHGGSPWPGPASAACPPPGVPQGPLRELLCPSSLSLHTPASGSTGTHTWAHLLWEAPRPPGQAAGTRAEGDMGRLPRPVRPALKATPGRRAAVGRKRGFAPSHGHGQHWDLLQPGGCSSDMGKAKAPPGLSQGHRMQRVVEGTAQPLCQQHSLQTPAIAHPWGRSCLPPAPSPRASEPAPLWAVMAATRPHLGSWRRSEPTLPSLRRKDVWEGWTWGSLPNSAYLSGPHQDPGSHLLQEACPHPY